MFNACTLYTSILHPKLKSVMGKFFFQWWDIEFTGTTKSGVVLFGLITNKTIDCLLIKHLWNQELITY